jgi:major membrane immunogen (membrane-anchored lipoprotein)
MNSYAIIDKNGLVINTILWDAEDQPDYDYGISSGNKPIKLQDGDIVNAGYTYNDGNFSAPAPTQDEINTQKELSISRNIATKDALMAYATLIRDTLQDAVDIGGATDQEAAALPLWKKYRVLLNRVDANTEEDIDWPVQPA